VTTRRIPSGKGVEIQNLGGYEDRRRKLLSRKERESAGYFRKGGLVTCNEGNVKKPNEKGYVPLGGISCDRKGEEHRGGGGGELEDKPRFLGRGGLLIGITGGVARCKTDHKTKGADTQWKKKSIIAKGVQKKRHFQWL